MPALTHVLVLPYEGWAACQLERGFAVWLLQRHLVGLATALGRVRVDEVCPRCLAVMAEVEWR